MRYSIHMWQQHPSPPNPFPSPNLGGGWQILKKFLSKEKNDNQSKISNFQARFQQSKIQVRIDTAANIIRNLWGEEEVPIFGSKNFILHQNRVKS